MFIDYQSKVLQDYERKKANNGISLNLKSPTPGNIKDECKAVCEERYLAKDEQLLKTFFGKRENLQAYIWAIDNHKIDKFRPLLNYLNGKVETPNEKNIELLAWLINFEPRPYDAQKWKNRNKEQMNSEDAAQVEVKTDAKEEQEVKDQEEKIIVETKEREPEMEWKEEKSEVVNIGDSGKEEQSAVKTGVPEEDNMPEIIEDPAIPQNDNRGQNVALTLMLPAIPVEPKSRFTIPRVAILIFLIMSVGTGIYFFSGMGNGGCMYWAGDHYEPVSCNQKLGDTLVVALDTRKLSDFKKITRPDTITRKCKGKVWYVKVSAGIEFYTSDGFHPIEFKKRLLPITDYIIAKYIHPQADTLGEAYNKLTQAK